MSQYTHIYLGCGHHRFAGYTHVDANPNCKPDVPADIVDFVATLPAQTVRSVIAWHVLEHLTWEQMQQFIVALWRASAPGAVWSIRVPHCSSIFAFNPQHRSIFCSSFWDFWKEQDCTTLERYGEERVQMLSITLRILAADTGLMPGWVRRAMPNWIFNSFGRSWQMVCERFWPFRFDEIEWKIEVLHSKKDGPFL